MPIGGFEMKKNYILFPIVLLGLTSCSQITRMNNLIYDSTDAIDANRDAVERSTCVIRRNAELIEETNRAIEINRKHLEAISKEGS